MYRPTLTQVLICAISTGLVIFAAAGFSGYLTLLSCKLPEATEAKEIRVARAGCVLQAQVWSGSARKFFGRFAAEWAHTVIGLDFDNSVIM